MWLCLGSWKEFFADPLHLALHEHRVKQEQELPAVYQNSHTRPWPFFFLVPLGACGATTQGHPALSVAKVGMLGLPETGPASGRPFRRLKSEVECQLPKKHEHVVPSLCTICRCICSTRIREHPTSFKLLVFPGRHSPKATQEA